MRASAARGSASRGCRNSGIRRRAPTYDSRMPLFSLAERRIELIGRNHYIAYDATLVTEGKEIPDGVLVLGSPGKIVRELKPKERENLLGIARGYVERAALYRRELKPAT